MAPVTVVSGHWNGRKRTRVKGMFKCLFFAECQFAAKAKYHEQIRLFTNTRALRAGLATLMTCLVSVLLALNCIHPVDLFLQVSCIVGIGDERNGRYQLFSKVVSTFWDILRTATIYMHSTQVMRPIAAICSSNLFLLKLLHILLRFSGDSDANKRHIVRSDCSK